MKIKDQKGNWVYLFPIKGLEILPNIGGEIKIDQTTFISRSKLQRVIRTRFKINYTLKELTHKDIYFSEIFKHAKVFAIIRRNGSPRDKQHEVISQLNNAVHILASSLLMFKIRGDYNLLSASNVNSYQYSYMGLIENSKDGLQCNPCTGTLAPIQLSKSWKYHNKDAFFLKLLKVINKDLKIADSWRKSLYRAAVLIGKSQSSEHIEDAFLYNMIALETVLTERNDKESEALPNRLEALLGWVGYWETEMFHERINGLYQKRCKYVHDGDSSDITYKDLCFLEELIFNAFNNILNHLQLFKGKQDLIKFTQMLGAEKTLGIKSRIRPKTMVYRRWVKPNAGTFTRI